MTIAERVAAGTAWLDEKIPDWWRAHGINLDSFEMASDCRCVVGQLAPQKVYGLAIHEHWLDLTSRLAIDLGFYAISHALADPEDDYDDDKIDAEYHALQAEWVRVITERREAANAGS